MKETASQRMARLQKKGVPLTPNEVPTTSYQNIINARKSENLKNLSPKLQKRIVMIGDLAVEYTKSIG